MVQERPRVALAFHPAAHYREGLLAALSEDQRFEYHFFFDDLWGREGIRLVDSSTFENFRRTPLRLVGPILWQHGVVGEIASGRYAAAIMTGDAHDASTWIVLLLARIRKVPVLLWTQGWRGADNGVRRLVRKRFYKLSSGLLLYGNLARRTAISEGFALSKLRVVYNSLPMPRGALCRAPAQGFAGSATPDQYVPSRPTVIFCSRMKALKRVDLLVDAAAHLRDQGRPINLILIGDGPQHGALQQRARSYNLPCLFLGPVHDIETLARWYSLADCAVIPSHAGLAVIQALQLGVPVIIDDDEHGNGPEAEAVVPGITGERYVSGSAVDLARRITEVVEGWAQSMDSEELTRYALEYYSPESHASRFSAAVEAVLPNATGR